MKKFKLFAMLFAVLALAVSCETIDPIDPNNPDPDKPQQPDTEMGAGTVESPFTVAGAIKAASGEAWIKGTIVGVMVPGVNVPEFSANNDTVTQNVIIADSIGEEEVFIPVQLPRGEIRDLVNIAENKDNFGKELLLYGTIAEYFQKTGVKNPLYVKVGDKEAGTIPGSGLFSCVFSKDMCGFTEYSVKGDQKWEVDTKYGYVIMRGSVKEGESHVYYENEDWLISPEISLASVTEAKMTIDHVIRYTKVANEDCSVWVSEDYTEGDPTTATWKRVTTAFEDGKDWTITTSGEMNLTPYCGKKIRIAFKFMSSTEAAGTWEIKSVLLEEGQAIEPEEPVVPETGAGSESEPYNVASAIANQGGVGYVEGYIVGVYNFEKNPQFVFGVDNVNTSLLIADETGTPAVFMPVQLPSGDVRNGINLMDHPENLGKKVVVYGSLIKYCGKPGLKEVSYAKIDGKEYGSKPVIIKDAILDETLMTQESFDKFTAFSVAGDFVWKFDSKYGAKMSGFDNEAKKSVAQEDWLISPAMDFTGKTDVKVLFEHARGPQGSIKVGLEEGWYKVMVSNDYKEGDPTTATWTELEGVNHGDTAWGYVSSGELAIPAANLKANARIAFKYVCTDDKSATWEIKNLKVY